METVELLIDNIPIKVPAGTTILKAAEEAGVHIPTLCYLEDINEIGACRICVVEVEGYSTLAAACVMPVHQGMVVKTNTPAVRASRRMNLELILSDHDSDCPTCIRNGNCELQTLCEELNVRNVRFEGTKKHERILDTSTPALVRDTGKCILCYRCVSVCDHVQGVDAIAAVNRGFETTIAPAFNKGLIDVPCVECGQCILTCPVGALYEKECIDEVWTAIADKEKFTVVQTAPATRVSIGEEFGMEPGDISTGQMVAALRRLGFDAVMDTDFTADLTIMEEGHEFIERLTEGGVLPLITSCSPGWVKYMEHFYPEFIPNMSTCKSPQQMFGALAKTFYAEKIDLDPEKVVSVSIMPCTAKKYEAQRPEMRDSGYQDVDYVLTTRELARMIKEAGIDFKNLPEEDYDDPMGESTGAAVIFGATGGVMEAALRTAYEVITGKTLASVDFHDVRGLEGIKEATVDVDGTEVKVAVAHSLGHARELLERVKAGSQYHFIEIMGCPGGCIGGGGQPIPTDTEIRDARMKGIYEADEAMALRKSHDNPSIKAIYEEYLGKPLGDKSHHLLHTEYTERSQY
ncbi:MAG: 2Fe-2S iron-sulfur cluster binding domain-containing protein [Clostridia bacterium]|nr:2Fe-2S iron-sulfur cluster binding domain-containing protein [Clostridia bacterium]